MTLSGGHGICSFIRLLRYLAVAFITSSVLLSAAVDTIPPKVSMTQPANNALVGSSVKVTASGSDNVSVIGVQFLLDGANLGAEDKSSPYTLTWNTTSTTAGAHVLAARARDAAGNAATATITVIVDYGAPTGTIVINNNNVATNTTAAVLSVIAADAESGITQMRFSNTGTSFSAAQAFAPTNSWSLAGGSGSPKTVYVQFKDAAGNWSTSYSDTIIYDTAPPAISTVTASSVSSFSATINWTTNEPASSQLEYGPTTAFGQQTALDASLVTTHLVIVSGLQNSTSYNYRVKSIDRAGNLATGNTKTLTTLVDTVPPTVPTNLSAVSNTPTSMNVTWSPATDNLAVGGYKVYRNGILLSTVAANAFTDTALAPNTRYAYAVSAFDATKNESAQTAPVNSVTQADLTAPTINISSPANGSSVVGVITVIATAADDVIVAGVGLRVDDQNIGNEIAAAPYFVNLDTSHLSNGDHILTAIATDSSGNSAVSAPVTITVFYDTSAPSIPTDLLSSHVAAKSLTFSWSASIDDVALAGYKIYRDGAELADITGSSFDDSGLVASTTYSYAVAAYDTSHNLSLQSAPLAVTTSPASIPVDDLIDMNVAQPDGTTLTTTIINNGLIGPDRAVSIQNGNGLSIGSHRISRAGPVTVGGVTYPSDHSSRSIVVDHTRNFENFEIDLYDRKTRQLTIAGWVTFGPPDAGALGQLFDYWNIYGGTSGEFVVMQLDNGRGGTGYGLNVETNPRGKTTHSSYITLTPGATYWCVLHADYVSGVAQLSVYDTSLTLVGNVVTTQTTGEVIGFIRIGNGEIGTANAKSYIENVVLDYSNAVYPLVPGF